jgi:hypothetical protein
MDPLDIAPGDENEGFDVSDRPHIEIMFDALDDTVNGVTGSEGFGLTEAQRYAEGVLMASGAIKASSVGGNESFFGSIATGAKSVYEYIVKMFKGLWGFFFNRDAPALLDKAKEDVTEFKKELDEIGKGSEKEIADQISTMKGRLESLAQTATGAELTIVNSLLEREKKAKTPAEQKEVILMIGHEAPKFNKDGQAAFVKAVQRIVDKLTKLLAFHEDSKKKSMVGGAEHGLAWEMFQKMNPFITASKKFLDQLEEIKELGDLNKAKSVAQAMINDIDEAKKAVKAMNDQKNTISKQIAECEKQLKESTAENKTATTLLGQLRVILAYCSGFAHHVKTSVEDILTLKKATKRVFCL